MIESNVRILCDQFGSARKLSRILGISHSLISKWDANGGEIPAKYNDEIIEASRVEANVRLGAGAVNVDVEKFLLAVRGCLDFEAVCKTCGRPYAR